STMKFGVHTGPQNCSYEDLRRAWRTADDNGFEWVSIWDHFYPALTDPTGTCFEAVSSMTALACETRRVRVGCLVFCAAYRNPAQPRPRLWLGGGGERRFLRMVARYADAWNAPFVGPDVYAHKNRVLTEWCEQENRDPDDVLRTVNLGLAMSADDAAAKRKR